MKYYSLNWKIYSSFETKDQAKNRETEKYSKEIQKKIKLINKTFHK
jgi:hypothetical protein